MTFKDVLVRRRIPFKMRAGKRIQLSLCCPFCTSRGESADTRYRLGVNLRENWGNCFNCDWKARNGAVQKILRQLALPIPENLATGALDAARRQETGLPEGFMLLHGAPTDLPCDPFAYLKTRGVSRKQIKRTYVGVTYTGRFTHRILFPVIWRGDYYGVVGRAFTAGHEPKYLNSYGDKRAYNVPDTGKEIILSEGIFKALRIERACAMSSGALLGHKLTDDMLEQLQNTGVRKVMVWPDKDQAGTRGALDAARVMHAMGWQVYLPDEPLPYADNISLPDIRECVSKFSRYSRRLAVKLRAAAIGVSA